METQHGPITHRWTRAAASPQRCLLTAWNSKQSYAPNHSDTRCLVCAAARFGALLPAKQDHQSHGKLLQDPPQQDVIQVTEQSQELYGRSYNNPFCESMLLCWQLQGAQQHPDTGKQSKAEVTSETIGSRPEAAVAAEEVDAVNDDSCPHLLPKVWVAYDTKPGETPRRVQIQRYS